MKSEQINIKKQKEMESRLNCVFREDGEFAEMSVDLAEYEEKTLPIDGVTFGLYGGDREKLRQTVASVEEDWVRYFGDDTTVFCGYIDGKPVSFCIVENDADCILSASGVKTGSIGCVGTVPRYRRRGIGLRMVDLAAVYLKNSGFDKAYIHYTAIDKWYGKLGFETFARFSFR